jgi:phenylalanyl-tRNA synthetase beta chain
MRVSINWLKELVEINLSAEELAKTLTMAGFEVESIEDLAKNADGVVVGRVIECDRHPNADKLSVTKVDIGTGEPLNVVCGAPNVRKDIYVAVATVGAYLAAIDLKIKKSKLRGAPSEGMICSLAELGLSKDAEGIYIFSQDNLVLGRPVAPLLGLDDIILDLTATANRADALSMVGVAREVAALTGGVVKLPEAKEIRVGDNKTLALDIIDGNACPAYIGTVIEGVKIAPSPAWLKSRLHAAGIRPINNVVDITNYILIEWGQPLHAFDREKLVKVAGDNNLTIGVRFATEGETITTLDNQKRELVAQNFLITANNNPVALAGVMGGEETEVDNDTHNIVLEAALFHPVTVRRSSRAQGLRSEASTRYERSVNLVGLDIACQRAVALLEEIAGGKTITQAIYDNRGMQAQRGTIELRLSRIQEILGLVKRGDGLDNIQAQEVEDILTALACKLEKIERKADNWRVTVPPYRYRDLEREIDLIEEVARLYGYDRFCDTLPDKTAAGFLPFDYALTNRLREAFRGVGLTELVHYSLVKPEEADITLSNPLFVEYSALRRNLINGLIEAFQYNLSQGNGALNGFEVGRIFWKEGEEMKEADAIGGIYGGDLHPLGNWIRGGKPAPMDWYEAKGILESVFQQFNLKVEYQAEKEDNRFHPGRTASLWLNGERLGIFGQLHPELRQIKDLPEAVYVFQLSLDILCQTSNKNELIATHFQAYSTYPSSARDVSFFASRDITVAELEKAMSQAAGKLLDKVELFDRYEGKNVPEGQRSLAFSLVYRAIDRTLTDEDVEPVHAKVTKALVDKFQVTLRV